MKRSFLQGAFLGKSNFTSRGVVRGTCRVLIGALLMAQLAISAYACPMLAAGLAQAAAVGSASATPMHDAGDAGDAGTADAQANTADDALTGCAGTAGSMDSQYANLCAEHCHQGQQIDQAAHMGVPAALLNALYSLPLAAEAGNALHGAPSTKRAPVMVCAPLTILHCCFRF